MKLNKILVLGLVLLLAVSGMYCKKRETTEPECNDFTGT